MVDELEQQKRQVESEARRERQRLAAQARAAREKQEREAREAQDRIRRQQSNVEREAEAAKAMAREAERREQRKRALPLTRPVDLGTAQTIAGIEKQRVEAHKVGGKARADIETEKAKGVADIKAQEAKAEAQIAEWESESLGKIAAIQAEFVEVKGGYISRAVFEKLSSSDQKKIVKLGVEAFNKKKEAEAERRAKDRAKEAQRLAEKRYDKAMARSGPDIFAEMVATGDIPKGATFDSYNKDTGEVNYTITTPPKNAVEITPGVWVDKGEWGKLTPSQQSEVKKTGGYTVVLSPEEQFKSAIEEGTIPPKSKFIGPTAEGGFEYKLPPPVYEPGEKTKAFIEEYERTKDQPPPPPQSLWQSITPWKEEAGETFGSAITEYFGKQFLGKDAPTQAELAEIYEVQQSQSFIERQLDIKTAFGGGIVIKDPKTGEYYVTVGGAGPGTGVGGVANIAKVAAAIVAGYGAYTIIPAVKGQNISIPHISNETRDKIIKNVSLAAINFRDTTGRIPGTVDAIVTNAKGTIATTIGDFSGLKLPGFPTIDIDIRLPGFSVVTEKVAIPPFPGKLLEPIEIPPIAGGLQKPVVYLPTPALTLEQVTGRANAYLLASEGVQVAENKVRVATKTIEVNWDKILTDIHRAKTQETVRQIFTQVDGILKKANASPDIRGSYRRAYEEYLAKWRLLSNAGAAYVASLNMQPILGASTQQSMAAAAGLLLAKQIAEQSFVKYLAQGKTAAQAASMAYQDTLTATKTLTATQTMAQTLTQTATQTAVKTLTATKAITKTQATTATKALTKAATATRTATRTATATGILTMPTVTLPDGKKHRMTPEEMAGAVGWKQGFIYKMIFPPYGHNNIVNTRKPIKGIKYYKGPQSAYKSIVRLGGFIPGTIKRDMGIMDITITTTKMGKPRMVFKLDRKQKTKLTPGAKRLKRLRDKRKARRARPTPMAFTARG